MVFTHIVCFIDDKIVSSSTSVTGQFTAGAPNAFDARGICFSMGTTKSLQLIFIMANLKLMMDLMRTTVMRDWAWAMHGEISLMIILR